MIENKVIDILNNNLIYLVKRKTDLSNKLSKEINPSKKEHIQMLLDMIDEGLIIAENSIKEYKDKDFLTKDIVWFHRTTTDNLNKIKENGFKLPKESSRFGKGIYFMNNPDNMYFGDKILTCKIKGDFISLWHEEIRNIFKEYNLEPEEEGIELLEDYIKNLNYDAVEIKYLDGTSELVVYNADKIKIIK